MVGEKGHHFYPSESFNVIERKIIKIDDQGEAVFGYIYDKINEIIKRSKNTYTITFFNENFDLKNLFHDKKNKPAFIKLSSLVSEGNRLIIRNYYLTLIHQLGWLNYKDESHLVSTSSHYSVARKFAGTPIDGTEVVLHCWQPCNKGWGLVSKHNFPVYKKPPYMYQWESSILAGILPHYITGLEIVGENRFYLNPNIFSNEITDELFKEGLNINQEDFNAILKKTGYKKPFEIKGENITEL